MRSFNRTAFLFILIFLLKIPLLIAKDYSLMDPRAWNYKCALSLAAGLLDGKSEEIVYLKLDGRKGSELVWDLAEVPMIELRLKTEINKDWVVDVAFWHNIGPGTGMMVDTDWLHSSDPTYWTEQSVHDVDVKKGEILDVSLAYCLLSLEQAPINLSFKGGLRYVSWSWEDYVRFAVYSSDPSGGGLRDIFIPGNAERGIDYTQWMTIPYLGLELETQFYETQVIFRGNLSSWVNARDRDFHINRNMLFEDSAKGAKYFSLGMEIKREIFSKLGFSIAYDYEELREARADTVIYSLTNPPQYFDDGAGIAYHSQRLVFGLFYDY